MATKTADARRASLEMFLDALWRHERTTLHYRYDRADNSGDSVFKPEGREAGDGSEREGWIVGTEPNHRVSGRLQQIYLRQTGWQTAGSPSGHLDVTAEGDFVNPAKEAQ